MMITKQDDFSKLVAYQKSLDEKTLLKNALHILIKHIEESEKKWNESETKKIELSFSAKIGHKLFGKERLFFPDELSEIISNTLSFLIYKKDSDEYELFYKNSYGASSVFLKYLSVLCTLDAFVIAFNALSVSLFPAIAFTVFALGLALLANFLITKSYPSSFAKEMGDIAHAFEEYKETRRLGVN